MEMATGDKKAGAAAAKAAPPPKQSRPTASMPRPQYDWKIPDTYEIKRPIGSGSYGMVHEAYDRTHKRVVAIKRIHKVFEDLVDCKRILREIAILTRLNDSSIVKALDICVPNDLERFDELYLVLEIADSDFKKLFRSAVNLNESHIRALLFNLLVGVKYLHCMGIIHRDLKPANCLVNQDCSVKICDFGLARTVRGQANDILELPSSPREEELVGVQPVKAIKRALTGHVVTRWYRAPELILLQENYTDAIDVWSVGCIFAELLNMMAENIPYHPDRGALFPGSSCFPLSPAEKHGHEYSSRTNKDQLMMIFHVLGTPSEEDIEALEKEDAKRYLRLFRKTEPISLAQRFRASSPDAVDLLKRMLVFNPNKRITIDECLDHPLFADIQRPECLNRLRRERATPVTLPFDDWQSMSEPQLRLAFLKEIQRFHPEVEIPPSISRAANV